MYHDKHRHLWTFWAFAFLGFGLLGVAILFMPANVVAHMRVDLYYSPGYVIYQNATGRDFDGGTEWWHYVVIVGGTAIVWASLATLLAWVKEKFESLIAYVSFVAFILVALVFVWSAYGMIPKIAALTP